jgi:L-ascorbate metabolism protein UlaG (beta-lactamase superfamily)
MGDDQAAVEADVKVVWLGHASVDVRMCGARFVTDPVLRPRLAHLRRYAAAAPLEPGPIDAVLLSHLHHDHLDLPTIRRLPPATPLVVPLGSGRAVARMTGRDAIELAPGDHIVIAGTQITAVPASHSPGRFLRRIKGEPIGFLLERGDRIVYFAGDTDLHPVMADLPAPDAALIPIWGWGPTLGPGHLDPTRAAAATGIVRARLVVPIHWGTFAPMRLGSGAPSWLRRPADDFVGAMRDIGLETPVALISPSGGAVEIPRASEGGEVREPRGRSGDDNGGGAE